MDKVPHSYQWIPFYEALANKLLTYEDKREELFELIKKLSSEQTLMQYFHFEREDWWGNRQIDPFSIMGVINRNIKDENRAALAKVLAETFGLHDIEVPSPTQYVGIPLLDARNSFFNGTNELWNLFCHAIESADMNNLSDSFIRAFDDAVSVKGTGAAKITCGLYWIRPHFFMPLDVNSRDYVSANYGIAVPKNKFDGEEYVRFLSDLRTAISVKSPNITYPEISHAAWIKKDGNSLSDPSTSPQGADEHRQRADENKELKMAKNMILHGPPGTGKTYSSVQYAVAIIEEKPIFDVKAENYTDVFKRYSKYKEDGLVRFVTFHQSYGYEEFIEGIRPVLSTEEDPEIGREISYEIHDGVFKDFCSKAGIPVGEENVDLGIGKSPTVWKVSLGGTGDNPVRQDCLENNYIRIGWDSYGPNISDITDFSREGGKTVLNTFYNRMKIGDIVFSCYTNRTIDAIGVITGEPEWHDEIEDYKRIRKVNWIVKDISQDIFDYNNGKVMTLSTVYELSVSVSDAIQILRELKPSLFSQEVKIPNRVFIIDEINRGNISKIFGELITLIEPSKRLGASEQQRAKLPYSGDSFGIPDNVYIIGTMNTADRSIALIDTALRRRFEFVEIQPDPAPLEGVRVGDIDVARMLSIINKRITVLLDREHTIGHSYLLPLNNEPTIGRLATIFRYNIIPLLQEYFYDDYEKIQLVLGDNQKNDDSTCFIVRRNDAARLFGNPDADLSDYYEVNVEAFMRFEAYEFLQ